MARFAIKRGWSKPLLVAFTATEDRSYVDVSADRIEVRFGYYRLEIPRDQVESAAIAEWPWWGGIGWRTNFSDNVALIGESGQVVRFRLKPRMRVRVLRIPIMLRDLYVSVEDPEALLAELARQPGGMS